MSSDKTTAAGGPKRRRRTMIGATTAVIRTPEVAGTIALDGTMLQSAEIVADFTALVSDESRRDDAVHLALDTDHDTQRPSDL